MGEFADMALEGVMDHEEARLDFRVGRMGYTQAYDEGIIDELGYEIGTEARLKTCRHCRTGGLHWVKETRGWRLSNDSGTIHTCKGYKR
jgi:hypothetical protein